MDQNAPKLAFTHAKEQVELVRILLYGPAVAITFLKVTAQIWQKRTKFHKYFSDSLVFIFLCDRFHQDLGIIAIGNLSQRNMKTNESKKYYKSTNPRDLWLLRHLIKVMRRHDMINKDKDIQRTQLQIRWNWSVKLLSFQTVENLSSWQSFLPRN